MMKKTMTVLLLLVAGAVSLSAMAKSPFEKEIIDFCEKFKLSIVNEEPGTREYFSGKFQGKYGIAVTQPIFFNQKQGLRIRKPGVIPDKILLPNAKFEFLRAEADTVTVEVFHNGEKAEPPLPTLRKLFLRQEEGRWVINAWDRHRQR